MTFETFEFGGMGLLQLIFLSRAMTLHTGGIIPYGPVKVISRDRRISLSGKEKQKPYYNRHKNHKPQYAFHVIFYH